MHAESQAFCIWIWSITDGFMEKMTIEIYHKQLVKGEVDAFLPLKKNRQEGMEELSAWNWTVQFSSVAQSCLTLCDPMDCSMPGLPIHHQLPELTQTRPSSRWCHPTISSSVFPFYSCLQSFLASGSFPMSVRRIRWPKYWSFCLWETTDNLGKLAGGREMWEGTYPRALVYFVVWYGAIG